jgi:hypothetical protein
MGRVENQDDRPVLDITIEFKQTAAEFLAQVSKRVDELIEERRSEGG